MNSNEQIIKDTIAALDPRVTVRVFLDLLAEYCKQVGKEKEPKAALSALLLFKMAYTASEDNPSARMYLSDSFRVYSGEILRSAPDLGGLLRLSAGCDRIPYSTAMMHRLKSLREELSCRSAELEQQDSRLQTQTEEVEASTPLVGTFGDLGNAWFASDSGLDVAYGKLDALPHFVPSLGPDSSPRSRRAKLSGRVRQPARRRAPAASGIQKRVQPMFI